MALVGVATVYAMVGGPLYCDTGQCLVYSEQTEPWVALDVKLYDRWADCGDLLLLEGNGWELSARAWDAGPLHLYHIEDWPELPILVDVPAHLAPFAGLSAQVKVTNVSRSRRWAPGGRR